MVSCTSLVTIDLDETGTTDNEDESVEDLRIAHATLGTIDLDDLDEMGTTGIEDASIEGFHTPV